MTQTTTKQAGERTQRTDSKKQGVMVGGVFTPFDQRKDKQAGERTLLKHNTSQMTVTITLEFWQDIRRALAESAMYVCTLDEKKFDPNRQLDTAKFLNEIIMAIERPSIAKAEGRAQ